MILQALNEYYDRQRALDPYSIPPQGFEYVDIHCFIGIDKEGNFLDLEETWEKQKQKVVGRPTRMPQGVERSSGIRSNLLYDNPGYVLGIGNKGEAKRSAFVSEIGELLEACPDSISLKAVLDFYGNRQFEGAAMRLAEIKELAEANVALAFRLYSPSGTVIIGQDEELEPLIAERIKPFFNVKSLEKNAKNPCKAVCLVSGEQDVVAELHRKFGPGKVRAAKSTGSGIVSFNDPAYTSYQKSQGYNSPVGVTAAFRYSSALDHLLRYGSEQKIQVADMTLAFWSERQNEIEDMFGAICSDDPARYTQAINALYQSPWSGKVNEDPEGSLKFYVLGLAPNSARLSVRLWEVARVADIGARLYRHFRRLELFHPGDRSEPLPLRRLLKSVAILEKEENIPPLMAGALLRAILNNQEYPRSLFAAAVRRYRVFKIKSNGKERPADMFAKTALIKACINRNYSHQEEELTMALDPENRNIGYRLGRLFSLLEQVQQVAQNPKREKGKDLNKSVLDRFYSQASTSPAAAFSRLLKLKTHHIGKIRKENSGLAKYFENAIGEVVNGIDDIPHLLKLEDQGRFAVGYYHQRQYRKSKEEEPVSATDEDNT